MAPPQQSRSLVSGFLRSLLANPGSPALEERRRWVVAVARENQLDRITLTLPALASSKLTAFLVAGAGKRVALARARSGDPALPASRLRSGRAIYWFADRAAAGAPVFSGE